jgi:rhodanese-related sulfurtransferase
MPTDISREEVQRLVREGAQLVDVRPDPEYEEEHLAGAISVPLKTLDATTAGRALNRDRPVVVY